MRKFLLGLSLVALVSLAGCSAKELGPADESEVQTADPKEIEKGMQESLKYVPKNAQVPPGVLPPGASPGGATGK
jgi:hypothetical protein